MEPNIFLIIGSYFAILILFGPLANIPALLQDGTAFIYLAIGFIYWIIIHKYFRKNKSVWIKWGLPLLILLVSLVDTFRLNMRDQQIPSLEIVMSGLAFVLIAIGVYIGLGYIFAKSLLYNKPKHHRKQK